MDANKIKNAYLIWNSIRYQFVLICRGILDDYKNFRLKK